MIHFCHSRHTSMSDAAKMGCVCQLGHVMGGCQLGHVVGRCQLGHVMGMCQLGHVCLTE